MIPEEEFHRRIADNLFFLRNYYGYTQDQLAAILYCERSTYSYMEQGKSLLSLYRLHILCELYHLPPEAMWSDLRTDDHLWKRTKVMNFPKSQIPTQN